MVSSQYSVVSRLNCPVFATECGQLITDFRLGQQLDRGIHERLNSFTMDGADRKNLFEAKFCKFRSARFGTVSVDFIDGQKNRFATAAKPDGGFAVEGNNTFLHVYDEDDDVGGFDSEFNLFQCGARDDVIGFLA